MSVRNKTSNSVLKIAALGAIAALALTGCATNGGTTEPGTTEPTTATGTFDSGNPAYDALINAGPVAADDVVAANKWATKIKESGVLRVGGTETSNLFSLLNPVTGKVVGFDAGLTQLLSRYILGDAKTEVLQVTSATREEVIKNNQVDLVAATYSITPKRLEQIDFAGPYYSSYAGILVKKDNTTIKGLADLEGKIVATQAGSTGVALLEGFAPKAEILALPDQSQALLAVQQGRADAYVIDQSLLLTAVLNNPDLKVLDETFGGEDPYGIGVSKDSDAKAFINDFLNTIIKDGTWLKLWKTTIQDRTGIEADPTLPVIGSAGN
ncbi:MAG: glutamate ABC transporter substrate-binding protein [Microbacteriaceae bacterium]